MNTKNPIVDTVVRVDTNLSFYHLAIRRLNGKVREYKNISLSSMKRLLHFSSDDILKSFIILKENGVNHERSNPSKK